MFLLLSFVYDIVPNIVFYYEKNAMFSRNDPSKQWCLLWWGFYRFTEIWSIPKGL